MKKFKRISAVILVLTFIILVFSGCTQDLGVGEIVEIDIFHTSDIHGFMGENGKTIGYAKLKGYIDSFGNDGHMLLDSGDLLEGNIFANFDDAESAIKMVNAMGYDAIAPGNHEFNYGNKKLYEYGKILTPSLISANIRLDGELVFAPYIIKDIKGVKIGVFGLTIPDNIFNTYDGYYYDLGSKNSIIDDARFQTAALKEAGADIIIAVTHLGSMGSLTVSSKDIAKNVDGIDIILDGHSHSLYRNGKSVNGVVLSSVGGHMKNAGVVHISYNKHNGKSNIKAKAVAKSKIKTPDDNGIKALYEELESIQNASGNETIAEMPFNIQGGKASLKDLSGLGKVVSKAFLNETNADIALFDGGSVSSSSLKSGNITYFDMINAMPYIDTVITLQLTGGELKTVITDLLKYNKTSFMQFSGFTLEVDENLLFYPRSYSLKSVKYNGKEISDGDIFTMATTNYCCTYSKTLSDKEAVKVYDDMRSVTVKYFKDNSAEAVKSVIEENNFIVNTNVFRIILFIVLLIAAVIIITIIIRVIIRKHKLKSRKPV